MSKRGKRYEAARAIVDGVGTVSAEEAISLIQKMPSAKTDETVLVSARLGIDPAKSDQMVRGGVVLPKGLGKTLRVIVFAQGEKVQEAESAGADVVGLEDLIEKIGGGWFEFDVAIATPDVMGQVAKVARLLGPRSLMPNPKTGTVTFDVTQAVADAKAGKVDFKVDKGGNIHVPIGKKGFPAEDLKTNLDTLIDAVVRAKPSSAKGIYLKSMYLSPSMGPSVAVDLSAYR